MKTRNEIMTEAHKIARTLEGNYSARMKMALTIVWKIECVSDLDTSTAQAQLESGNDFGRIICEIVSFFATNFKADIANKTLASFRQTMSTKQAWCVAYEFTAILN